MSFSPQAFLSNLGSKGGPAKSNRYEVIIPIPVYLSTFVNNSTIQGFNDLNNLIWGNIEAQLFASQGYSVATSNPSLTRSLALQCNVTELPGKYMQTADVKIYGPTFKVPYQSQYQDLSFSFVCSNDFYERKLFDKWLECIMPLDTNNLRFPNGAQSRYLTNPAIIQYDDYVQQIYAVECIDAFPIGISSQPLSWGSMEFHQLTVSFAYQKYRTIYEGNYDMETLLPLLSGVL